MKIKSQVLLILMAFFIASCASPTPNFSSQTASANMHQKIINTANYQLFSYQRLTNPNANIRVYIEGDGRAYFSRSRPSNNPTPRKPIALYLALEDTYDNVVYLARPCQYSVLKTDPACAKKSTWTKNRFTQQIMNNYSEALQKISQNKQQKFELIGYSGGAAIALYLAANNSENIQNIRTVAGNVNVHAVNAHHHVSPMENAVDIMALAPFLKNIPQQHFVGENDKIILPKFAKNLIKAQGKNPCAKVHTMPKNTHSKGWQTGWKNILNNFPMQKCIN